MAIGTPIQKYVDTDVSASNPSATFTAPTSGNLLFLAITANKNTTSFSTPTGWTPCGVNPQNWCSVAQFYKVSDGTETAVSTTLGTAQSHNIIVYEIPFDGTPTLDTSNTGENSSNALTLAISATVANADSLCLGTWGHDSGGSGDSSSFDLGSELYFFSSGTANADIAAGIITGRAAGALTWTGGTATRSDQITGAIAVFYEVGGGASNTFSSETASALALVGELITGGTFASVTASAITFNATPTISLADPFHNGSTLLASETGITAYILNASTRALIATVSSLTTDASGVLAGIQDASLTASTSYKLIVEFSGGEEAYIRTAST